MLTKKHYKRFADMLASADDIARDYELDGEDAIFRIGLMMMDYFKEDNPRFDEARFVVAARRRD